jgi:endogenous inhibitor of DNA gyrase (YacG/DUF329 family)
MHRTSDEKFDIRQELKIIPTWAVILAVVLFAGWEGIFHGVLVPRDVHPMPLPLQLFFGFLSASVFAFLTLMVGYVNSDAKRRGMNRTLWTLLVIFVPNAIGFIIYFLMRQRLMVYCPHCGATANPEFNFCPKCQFELHPACPRCHRTIEPGAAFCPYCSADLKMVSSHGV